MLGRKAAVSRRRLRDLRRVADGLGADVPAAVLDRAPAFVEGQAAGNLFWPEGGARAGAPFDRVISGSGLDDVAALAAGSESASRCRGPDGDPEGAAHSRHGAGPARRLDSLPRRPRPEPLGPSPPTSDDAGPGASMRPNDSRSSKRGCQCLVSRRRWARRGPRR